MQGYVELKEKLPVLPRHLIGVQAKAQLASASGGRSHYKDALESVILALHVLSAVLTVSKSAHKLAAASCRYAFASPMRF